MSAAVDLMTGTTLTAGTSGWTAEQLLISPGTTSRPSIPTSHLATAAAGVGEHANATFMPGEIVDAGTIEVEGHFNPDTEPPIDQPAETWTIQWPASGGDATGPSWAASGFMTDFTPTGSLDDKMTFTASIKWSGNVTRTAGA